MQTSTLVVLLCLIAAVAVRAQQEPAPVDAQESLLETPTHERSPRNKRGLLLLKKKLILGALGLKAVKVGAVGAGVVGALALKAKSKPKAAATHTSYFHGDLPLVISW